MLIEQISVYSKAMSKVLFFKKELRILKNLSNAYNEINSKITTLNGNFQEYISIKKSINTSLSHMWKYFQSLKQK